MAFVVYRFRVCSLSCRSCCLVFQGGTTCKSGILPLDPLISRLVGFRCHDMSPSETSQRKSILCWLIDSMFEKVKLLETRRHPMRVQWFRRERLNHQLAEPSRRKKSDWFGTKVATPNLQAVDCSELNEISLRDGQRNALTNLNVRYFCRLCERKTQISRADVQESLCEALNGDEPA